MDVLEKGAGTKPPVNKKSGTYHHKGPRLLLIVKLKAVYNVQLVTEGQYALAFMMYFQIQRIHARCFLFIFPYQTMSLPIQAMAVNKMMKMSSIIENVPHLLHITCIKEKKYKITHFSQPIGKIIKNDTFICPNGENFMLSYLFNRTDRVGYTRTFKVYGCEDCSLRSQYTKVKEGNNRKS